MSIEAQTHVAATIELTSFLEGPLSYLKRLMEEIFALKNDLVKTSDKYFEKVKEHIEFFYQVMDLS